jgi:hypothetical protein
MKETDATTILGPPVCAYTWHTRSVYFGAKRWSRGVTTVVKRLFAPSYRYTKLKRGHCPVGLPKRQARRRGHAIDHTLHKWAGGQAITRSRLKEPRTLIQTFEARGWTPVCSQLVVAWPAARLATKIDLVLHDRARNKIIVVEVKSGCGYRRKSHGVMRHIVPTVSNAPLHQHQLQVLLGRMLFARTYTHWRPVDIECVLVYISPACDVELLMDTAFSVHYTAGLDTILLDTA